MRAIVRKQFGGGREGHDRFSRQRAGGSKRSTITSMQRSRERPRRILQLRMSDGEYSEALAEHHKRLALWAETCAENFANRAALVGAEIARLEGRELEAERLYEQAIRSAREQGFLQNEGLAYELAARFYATRGFESFAELYLRSARDCYQRWGADGKVRQLVEMYPRLRENEPASDSRGTSGAPVEQLDLATVLKVSASGLGRNDTGSTTREAYARGHRTRGRRARSLDCPAG